MRGHRRAVPSGRRGDHWRLRYQDGSGVVSRSVQDMSG